VEFWLVTIGSSEVNDGLGHNEVMTYAPVSLAVMRAFQLDRTADLI